MKGHTLITARYTDNERSIVEALWRDDNNPEVVREEIIGNDQDEFQDLLTRITEYELHENAVNYWRAQRENFINTVKQIAKEDETLNEFEHDIEELALEKFLDKLFDVIKLDENDINEESLFKFKLKLFEIPFIKNSKDRKLKTLLRKSKTYSEAIDVIFKIHNHKYFEAQTDNELFDIIIDKLIENPIHFNEERLFKLKLKLFDLPQITSSTNRTAKSKLRKAQTVLEVLGAVSEF